MSLPFYGEIRIFGGNFAPVGWMFCDGRLLAISQYETLFNLIGTTYGGDGQTTYALPDLRGRLPVHVGQGLTLGEFSGQEQVTVLTTHVPPHTHAMPASSAAATVGIPTGTVVADTSAQGMLLYNSAGASAPMAPAAIEPVGLNHPHENRMPYQTISFIIAVEDAIYPSQS